MYWTFVRIRYLLCIHQQPYLHDADVEHGMDASISTPYRVLHMLSTVESLRLVQVDACERHLVRTSMKSNVFLTCCHFYAHRTVCIRNNCHSELSSSLLRLHTSEIYLRSPHNVYHIEENGIISNQTAMSKSYNDMSRNFDDLSCWKVPVSSERGPRSVLICLGSQPDQLMYRIPAHF